MTHPVAVPRRMRRLLIVALFTALSTAQAQPPDVGGSWLDIDIVAGAGLPSRTEGTRSLFFYDLLDGFRSLSSVDDSTLVTSDGGDTWRMIEGGLVVPDGTLGDGFAWMRNGYTTSDAGRTWREPPGGRFSDYVVATRLAHAGLRNGLAVTDDGGATWQRIEPGLDTAFGGGLIDSLPSPPTMSSTGVSWVRLIQYGQGRVVGVSLASGTIDGVPATWYYLTTVDTKTRTLSAIELRMWRNFQLQRVRHWLWSPIVAQLTRSVIIVGEHEWDQYMNRPTFTRLWRTEDGGATWSPHDTLSWIDEPSLRFFSATCGVSSTARTTDGGRTWQRHARPFGAQFFALDSAHWFVADTYMLTARSTDAGETWTRSASSAPLRAVLAHRGNVVLARSQRSVLASSDAGASWSDIGRRGGLPDDLTQIVAMAWIDTAVAPGRIAGVGAFVEADGARTARLVTSSDYGRTWSEGARLPMLDYAVFSFDAVNVPITILATSGGEGEPGALFIGGPFGLIASTDEGATWEYRWRESSIDGLAMLGALSGVAMVGDWDNAMIGLYSTGDGGRSWTRTFTTPEGFVFPVGLALTDNGYRAIVSSFSAGHREWIVLSSYDGATWTQRRGSYDGPPLKGGDAFWSEHDRLHIVGRGASILFSPDGGATLSVHHDLASRFVHAHPADPTADLLYRPLQSARDGRDIYVVDYFANVGRWTIGDDVLSAPAASAATAGIEARLLLSRDGASARLEVVAGCTPGAPVPAAWLVDMRGGRRRVALEPAGARRFGSRLELADLPSGPYLVRVVGGAGGVTLPIVVNR